MSINLCDLCYELIVSACQDNYYLPTGLINGTDYTMSLEDLHGNVYTMTGSPTVDDEFIVTPNQFPDGMFTLELPAEGRLVLTQEALQAIVGTFDTLGKQKGWL